MSFSHSQLINREKPQLTLVPVLMQSIKKLPGAEVIWNLIFTSYRVIKVNIASRHPIPVRGEIKPTFLIAYHSFTKVFKSYLAQTVLYWEIHFIKKLQFNCTPRKS